MRQHPSQTLACLLLCLVTCGANAQARPDDALARTAITAAEIGVPTPPLPASHALQPWYEYAALRRDIDTLAPAVAQAFLARHQGQPVATLLREAWLASLAKREDWRAFVGAWSADVKGSALRCHALTARLRASGVDPRWTADAQAAWQSASLKPPQACDVPFEQLAARGGVSPAMRWQRIERAAADAQPAAMRTAASGLGASDAALANDYAAFVAAPHDRALAWPKTPRSRLVASHGLAHRAKADPGDAEARLPRLAAALDFGEAERARVLYPIALWTVASYLPESARRLDAVPAAAYDERLHEWRVREALARSDWPAARRALERMGATQRADSRWTYFAARLAEQAGNATAAKAGYRDAARKSDFHGFLAADRIDEPYALCPWKPDDSATARAAIARDPGIVRAMALYRIDRTAWAQREWDAALARFDDAQRRIAVGIAQANGWQDRGVFGLVNVGGKRNEDELRLYALRFPLAHDALIRREATRHGIDPAWVAAEIRAESIFNPKARSPANARGLMQVLPETGAGVARRRGLPWAGAESLYDPATNIAIGTAYLREMETKYVRPYTAIAAYNAGPTPTARWQAQRPSMDADFWIETISYKETRDYVARVLAFSVIYDWRLGGDAMPVTDRMNGTARGKRKAFVCPAG